MGLLAVPAVSMALASCAGAWWDVSDSPYDYYYDPTFPPPPYYGPVPSQPVFYPGSLGGPVYLPDHRPVLPPVGGNPGPAIPPANIGNRRPAIYNNGGMNRPQTGNQNSGGIIQTPPENTGGGNRRPR